MITEQLYNTVLCQAMSPCNRYLMIGDINGVLSVFDLQKILQPSLSDGEPVKLSRKPKCRFQLDQNRISSLLKTDDCLIIGQTGYVCGYDWTSLISNSKIPKQLWSVRVPNDINIDVNSLAIDGEFLYAGCDNGDLVQINSITKRVVQTNPTGHISVYDTVFKDNILVTCGEDGTVQMWDKRIQNPVKILDPVKENGKLARKKHGVWISSVDLNSDDWLICGGGPILSLWSLKMFQSPLSFESFAGPVFQARFCNDEILAAGSFPVLHRYSLDGTLLSEIPCSSTTIYSISYEFDSVNVLSMAGSSPKIDFCTTLKYRDSILSLI